MGKAIKCLIFNSFGTDLHKLTCFSLRRLTAPM